MDGSEKARTAEKREFLKRNPSKIAPSATVNTKKYTYYDKKYEEGKKPESHSEPPRKVSEQLPRQEQNKPSFN